ncbi:RNA-splicing ligase RtcB [Petralouisia muris]|jgi:RNA-splicing ligase RtcB|uniref:RNA-splicing ligase RtcB n=1 Tax=Petralouisia muris TaxID=3032872 RepID=A0AC61RNV4_9FIRM|nr:RtcB family protein [Petralouisia muris]TGY89396.1 RNA-splicing ligase RtcB [Petralouisia muris]
MVTIYGKYTNAIVYTTNCEEYAIDDYARKQLQMICDHPSAAGSKIRVMPDVHPGKVGTIGLTMTVGGSILPSLVGVDIGCGMTLAKIKAKNLECQKLDTVIREHVPSGGSVRKSVHRLYKKINLGELICYKAIDSVRALASIGTLGGGNHFIEVDRDDEGNLYLVIHSGSRHLGIEVTDHYLKKGQREQQMKKRGGHAPYEMACISGGLMDDYFHDLAITQEFAARNREAIVDEIVRGMKWRVVESYSCVHNYVDFSGETPVLRKGAIRADADERVIIPVNMRDGIILGKGLGNVDWNCSAPHGSGRVYKRSEVKEHYTVSEFKKEMQGIYSICISRGTLDEAPFAYRRMEDIVDVIGDTVKIEQIIRPVYSFKASAG